MAASSERAGHHIQYKLQSAGLSKHQPVLQHLEESLPAYHCLPSQSWCPPGWAEYVDVAAHLEAFAAILQYSSVTLDYTRHIQG